MKNLRPLFLLAAVLLASCSQKSEMDRFIDDLMNRMTIEQLKPYVDAEFEAAVVRSVLTSKVMKLIRDAAIVE